MHAFAVLLSPRMSVTHFSRYQRGTRSLLNIAASTSEVQEDATGLSGEVDEEEFEVPDEIAAVVENLLEGLNDSDTVVRWSAAKGIGRITMRLPRWGQILRFPWTKVQDPPTIAPVGDDSSVQGRRERGG